MKMWLKIVIGAVIVLLIAIVVINSFPGIEEWLHELTGWS